MTLPSLLQVQISDNGIPPLSSTTRVVVQITDENDESPQFTEVTAYRVRIPAMEAGSQEVALYRVVAYDNDEGPNADIDYSLKSKGVGRFSIHPKTGMIYSHKDFTAGSQYDLTVSTAPTGRLSASKTQAHLALECSVISLLD